MSWNNLSPSSKVWIYKANRELTASEQDFIRKELDVFIPQWAAHGNSLFGGAEVVENWFVVLVVDESQTIASGCSIDTSVQFMKALGKELNVDFFDRMHVLISDAGEKKQVHFSEIGNHPEAKIYNPLVSTLGEFTSNWLVPVNESQFA
ncbi:MAG: ABC transporter ATPase [Bacteroidetes bacterium]|nr:MAG: ABC transporter ATPase [Bacteroidota bacterium]